MHPNGGYTYSDYAALPADGRRYEILDGELSVTPAPSLHHQTVSRRLQYALMSALEVPGLAFIFNAPVDVILDNGSVVQPDLAIVRAERKASLSQRGIEGPPDVVVEILSPSTQRLDSKTKRSLYARHGIAEYWIVDPERAGIDVLRLEGGRYHVHSQSDVLRSPAFPQVAIPLAPLFAPL